MSEGGIRLKSINCDEKSLTGCLEIVGKIPWSHSTDEDGKSCNDPLVETFIAIRNQYRNVVAITMLPPVRCGDSIKCHILPSCVAHYSNDLPEQFAQITSAIAVDLARSLTAWSHSEYRKLYEEYFDMEQYALCNEIIEDFVRALNLRKAPPVNRSMLMEIVNQLSDIKAEEALKAFEVTEKQTLSLLT